MLTNLEAAKQVDDLMILIEHQLAGSMEMVEARCSLEEYVLYKRAVGKVVTTILVEILDPLYERNSSLKPVGWDD